MSGVSVMFQITGNSFSVSVMRWIFLVLPFFFLIGVINQQIKQLQLEFMKKKLP